jgi:glycosyltransferase involved in cell wall biosynthesis
MSAGRSRARVCLVTTSQPSTNPRLVKEADALTDAGYDVHVVASLWQPWALPFDRTLVASRRWTCEMVNWSRDASAWLFWKTRLRHRAASRLVQRTGAFDASLSAAALARSGPELLSPALRAGADLYIGHNLGAVPIVCEAAARRRARVGFDAEDWHSGQFAEGTADRERAFTERVERTYFPRCDYLTTAAPGMAAAYRAHCKPGDPHVILNVFPRQLRPSRPALPAGGPLKLYWYSQTIGPDRGLEDAVRAMAPLGDRVRLELRGQWWPGYETSLRQLAAECGVAQTQITSATPADPNDLVRLAAEHHVGLAIEPATTPNNRVLWSNKVFTYILAGTAISATATPGQQRLFEEIPGVAQLYAPGDVGDLTAIWRRWIDDPASLARARDAAWEAGERRYNWDVEQLRFLTIVDAALEGRAAPSAHAMSA